MREKMNMKVMYSAYVHGVNLSGYIVIIWCSLYRPKNLGLALDGLYAKLDLLGQYTITIIILSQPTSLLKIYKTIIDIKILELSLDCYCSQLKIYALSKTLVSTFYPALCLLCFYIYYVHNQFPLYLVFCCETEYLI